MKIFNYIQTRYYRSPEVLIGLEITTNIDIWSLGCVLYEMVTLHPPFKANDMEGLYKKVTKGFYLLLFRTNQMLQEGI